MDAVNNQMDAVNNQNGQFTADEKSRLESRIRQLEEENAELRRRIVENDAPSTSCRKRHADVSTAVVELPAAKRVVEPKPQSILLTGNGVVRRGRKKGSLRFAEDADGNLVTRTLEFDLPPGVYIPVSAEFRATSITRNIPSYTYIEDEEDVPGGWLLPSRDVRLARRDPTNPVALEVGTGMARQEIAAYRDRINYGYRLFVATARAHKYTYRRVTRLLITDSLLDRFDNAILNNSHHMRLEWPVMPRWLLDEMAHEESAADDLNDLRWKWPKQVSVVIVALGLDLLTRHVCPSAEPVLEFLTNIRDHLEIILHYPLGGSTTNSLVEFYKHKLYDYSEEPPKIMAKVKRPVFNQGLKLLAVTIPERGDHEVVDRIAHFNRQLRRYVEMDRRECPDQITIELLDWAALVETNNDQQAMASVEGRVRSLAEVMRCTYGVTYCERDE